MLIATLLAAASQLPYPLRQVTASVGAPGEDFCFPPFSSFTVRILPSDGNSSVVISQQIFLGADQRKTIVKYLATPFGGGTPPGGGPDGGVFNVLDNATDTWQWYSVNGAVKCDKFPGGANANAICIGADLKLNSTRIIGGRQAYSWVGFEQRSPSVACWDELLISSVESMDPSQWLGSTAQCVGDSRASVESLEFSDYSTAPFSPDTFALPSYCPK